MVKHQPLERRLPLKNYLVKDLMVPISEYATVPETATLYEAVLALEKAQEAYQQSRYSRKAVALQQEEYLKSSPPILDVYSTAAKLKVTDLMQRPTEGEYVDETTSLDMALHQLTTGSNLSLLVTRGADIVGVLRLADVFAAVFHAMKESETQVSEGVTR
jgi:CBS domain containing-hemolysin-like protein